MDFPAALEISREAMLTALMICGPVLAAGVVVGILISLLQTVTQIQDQTVSLVPKIVAMVAAAVFLVPWLLEQMLAYTREMFGGL